MTELKLRAYNKYYDGGVEEIVVGSKRGYKNVGYTRRRVPKARDVHGEGYKKGEGG